jgi:penicillin G amidase
VIVESLPPDSSALALKSADLPDAALVALSQAALSARRLHDLTGGGFDGIGSNSWVVDGTRTTTGAPILANDTHLAPQIPAIWFMNGLHCVELSPDCPDRMVGFSFAGAPGVVVGHNGHHAWGVTTQAVDTQDLFVERLNPNDPHQYEVDG